MPSEQSPRERTVCFWIVIMLCTLLLHIHSVLAMPIIISVSAPDVEAGQQQTITATITGNALAVTITIDSAAAQAMTETAPTVYIYTYLPVIGNHTFTITVLDADNGIASADGTFLVQDTTPPDITAAGPQGVLNTATVLLSVETDEQASCRYATADAAYDAMVDALDGAAQLHQKQLNLPEGNHAYYIRCSDVQGNAMQSSHVLTFSVDTNIPVLTLVAPLAVVVGDTTDMVISSSEPASCRYDTQNTSYEQMAGIFSAQGLQQTAALTALGEGTHAYVARCRDTAGNEGTLGITVSVNARPSATVSLERSSSLRAGTYEVRLDASEDLSSTPLLQYGFDGESGRTTITLVGSGRAWKGYLIVQDNTPNKIGSFSYRGIDLAGLEGTELTGDQLFLIDTTKPQAPSSLAVSTSKKGTVKLRWYYDGEKTKEFRIYRSTTGTVEVIDSYATATDTQYTDANVEEGQYYAYAVSAVDKAGNEGPLSSGASLTAEGPEALSAQVLAPELAARINRTIMQFQQARVQMDRYTRDLERSSDDYQVRLIKEKGLIDEAKAALRGVDDMIVQLQGTLTQNLSAEEVTKFIAQYERNLEKERLRIATAVTVGNAVQFMQMTTTEDIAAAQTEYLLGVNLSADEERNITAGNQRLQDTIKVSTTIITGSVTYLDGREEPLTLVQKTVTSTANASVQLVERIPKTIARSAADIRFSVQPRVLQNDPIVIWDVPSLGTFSVSYSVAKTVNLADAREATTTALLPYVPPIKKVNAITGKATSILPKVQGTVLLMIIGVVLILGLASYYVFMKPLPVSPQVMPEHVVYIRSIINEATVHADAARLQQAQSLYQTVVQIVGGHPQFQQSMDVLAAKIRVLDSMGCVAMYARNGDVQRLRRAVQVLSRDYFTFGQALSPYVAGMAVATLRKSTNVLFILERK